MAEQLPQDSNMDALLADISKTIGENRQFLHLLKEDRIDEDEQQPELPDSSADPEEFVEEL